MFIVYSIGTFLVAEMENGGAATLQWFPCIARRAATALSIPCHSKTAAKEILHRHWR